MAPGALASAGTGSWDLYQASIGKAGTVPVGCACVVFPQDTAIQRCEHPKGSTNMPCLSPNAGLYQGPHNYTHVHPRVGCLGTHAWAQPVLEPNPSCVVLPTG